MTVTTTLPTTPVLVRTRRRRSILTFLALALILLLALAALADFVEAGRDFYKILVRRYFTGTFPFLHDNVRRFLIAFALCVCDLTDVCREYQRMRMIVN
jgi:hypothetical protein